MVWPHIQNRSQAQLVECSKFTSAIHSRPCPLPSSLVTTHTLQPYNKTLVTYASKSSILVLLSLQPRLINLPCRYLPRLLGLHHSGIHHCGHSWVSHEHQTQVPELFNPFEWDLPVGKHQVFLGVKLCCHSALLVTPKKPFCFLQTDCEMILGAKGG